MIRIKRIYEPPSAEDGSRILVDRLWPRGISRQEAAISEWMREIAPSTSLRRRFNHDPQKWEEFKERYFQELDARPDLVASLLDQCARTDVTLIYSARDTKYNQAVALAEYLQTHQRP